MSLLVSHLSLLIPVLNRLSKFQIPNTNHLWCITIVYVTIRVFCLCVCVRAEVLQCFLATREAMQLQQNETVYESSGTSTLPSSTESPGTPEREPPPRPWDCPQNTEHMLTFPAACHLVVNRCLFLLLGVRSAWQEHSQLVDTHTESNAARSVDL